MDTSPTLDPVPRPISEVDAGLAELKAMQTVYEAMKALSDDGRRRVLDWVGGALLSRPLTPQALRFAVQGSFANQTQVTPVRGDVEVPDDVDVATFFSSVAPEQDTDKALVVAYWLQKTNEDEDLDSQQINTALKHLGHGVSNITRTLDQLQSTRPVLLIQTRKDGTSKQARKRYKVTSEGVQRVRAMLEARKTQP